jgi:hypothetical protein
MAGFLFRLETVDGAAADPSTLEAAVRNWKVGDSIHFGPDENETAHRIVEEATREEHEDAG